MKKNQICTYCEGKGFVEVRDCSGEVQREETCLLCAGIGRLSDQDTAQDNSQGSKSN